MFDTMTLTKLVGGVCGALLIFLFVNWAAESIYGLGDAGQEEGRVLAYSVAGAEAEGAAEAGAEAAPEAGAEAGAEAAPEAGAEAAPEGAPETGAEPSFAEVFATADAAAGEKVFGKCKACHKIDGTKATGPHLNGVVGRNHGAIDGFKYSDAMLALKDEVWTQDALDTFLKNPKAAIPGTKMAFAGLTKPEDRANVVAYLATLK